MKQQKVIFLLLVVTSVLIILLTTGVGYAAVTDNKLKINDNITASPEYADFKVEFTGETSYTGDGRANVKVTGKTIASMNITGLDSAGDSITVTFNIKNTSNEFYALLSERVTNSNTEYFRVTASMQEDRIGPKNRKTELYITVKLIKTPIYKEERANINVQFIATPEAV